MASAQQFHPLLPGTPTIHSTGRPPVPLRSFFHNTLQLVRLKRLCSDAALVKASSGLASRVLDSLGVRVAAAPADIALVPATGPVIVVANHPFGSIDGLMLDSVLNRIRPDVRVLANGGLGLIPELRERFFQVDVFSRDGSAWRNMAAMRAALAWLERGGMVVVFPGGETPHWDFSPERVVDPPWHTLPARLARTSGASVLPAHLEGSNSLAYHVANLIDPAVRKENAPCVLPDNRERTVRLRFGAPVSTFTLAQHASDADATQYLRTRTYSLAQRAARVARLPDQHQLTLLHQPTPTSCGANPRAGHTGTRRRIG